MYQHSWAVNGMVAVHESGRAGCRLRTTKKVATRPTYYRRQQPTGKQIDDIEACLAFVEDKATIPLREVVGGAEVTPEHKGALAQFLAVQMLRGPAFFERREEIVRPLLANLEAEDLRPGVLAAAGGDLEAVRSRVIAGYLGPTQKFMSMLQKAPKIAGVLGLMRWEYVSFDEPVLAYSDHPIVVWPSNARSPTKPFRGQQHGPLGAFEIRAPFPRGSPC